MKEDFQVIIDSLGNASLSFLSSSGVRLVRIYSDPDDQTAEVEICLAEDTWEKRNRAIHGMVELREMFMEDLSLEYRFIRCEDADESEAVDAAPSREFCLT